MYVFNGQNTGFLLIINDKEAFFSLQVPLMKSDSQIKMLSRNVAIWISAIEQMYF